MSVSLRPWLSSPGPSCHRHTVYAPWPFEAFGPFEDPSAVEILPRPWADSVLPSAPAQLMCEKQQLSGP